MTDSAGLAGNAAAVNGCFDIDLADGAGGDQRLTDDELQGLKTEVIVDITAVYGDSAGAVGDEVDARDGLLSASGAVHIRSFALISCHILFLLLAIPNFGLLSCVGVLGSGENAQTLELPLSDGVLLKHAADCKTHCQLRALCHQVLVLSLLQAADPAGVSTIVLLLELLAGQDCVLCVDDDDVIAAIDVRSIGGFELAAKQIGGNCGGLAEGLAGRVKDILFSFNGFLGKHCRGHICASKY